MALAPQIQIIRTSCLYTDFLETERGGILSLIQASGTYYATYQQEVNNDSVPLGVKLYDNEEVNYFCGIIPWRTRNAFPANTRLPYLTQGIVITNAIHPTIDPQSVMIGAPAYLAHSGLITNVTTFSNKRVGTFDSILNDSSLGIIGGVSSFRAAGNFAIRNPQPAIIPTAGWCRIRIKI